MATVGVTDPAAPVATASAIHHHTDPRPGVPPVHYVERAGPPGWPQERALVLTHGLGGNWENYDRAMPALAERARTIAIDLPGFGASPLPDGGISFDDHVDAVAAVLEHASVTQVVIAGHSMGGPLVLRFAQRYPGRASAVVLVCGTVQCFQQTLGLRLRPWLRAPRTAAATVAEVVMAAGPVPRVLHKPLSTTRIGRRIALWLFVHNTAELPARFALSIIAGAGARGVLPTARALGRITGWEHADHHGLPPAYAINGVYDLISPLGDLKRFPIPLRRATVFRTGHQVMLEEPVLFVEEMARIMDEAWN